MPDTGNAGYRDPAAPMQWVDAFAALPLESVQPQTWERLRARLPATPVRRRWPVWLAAAASLAVMVAVPWRMHSGGGVPTGLDHEPAPAITIGQLGSPPPAPAPAAAPVEETASPPPAPIADNDAPPARATATIRRPHRASAPPPASPEANLEPLYAESARLEELLALTRDDSVASGGIAALAVNVNAELADIDSVLAQPGLETSLRTELWHQRVDTLRQLAGIETTRLLLTARGETGDVVLVTVD